MPERAPFEPHPDQIELWKEYSTPACNSVRAKNKPPEPDADGLFGLDGVREICGRRQCMLSEAGEFSVMVTYQTSTTPLHATASGRWDPVAILKACSKAHGNQTYDVDETTAKPTNPGGVDEIKMARIVGANGLRPYLSKTGKHRRHPVAGRFIARDQRAQDGVHGIPFHQSGATTWSFLQVLYTAGSEYIIPIINSEVRKAIRALEDVGLVDVDLGPRGGMATASVTWTKRAMLQRPEPRPVSFASDDDRALECLHLGIK